MEREKLNWVIIGIVVLFVVWIISFSSNSGGYGCGIGGFGGYGMMGWGYSSFFGGVVMLLAIVVLALVAVWLFKQISPSRVSRRR